MPGTAVAATGVVEFGRVGFGIFDQVSQRVDFQTRGCVSVDHQHVRYAQHLRDGGKVSGGVVGHLAVQPRVDGVCGYGSNADGQTVWCCFGNGVCTNVAATAGFVVNDDGTQCVFDAFGHQAGRHIDWAAGCIGHDDPGDFGLRKSCGSSKCQGDGRQEFEGFEVFLSHVQLLQKDGRRQPMAIHYINFTRWLSTRPARMALSLHEANYLKASCFVRSFLLTF